MYRRDCAVAGARPGGARRWRRVYMIRGVTAVDDYLDALDQAAATRAAQRETTAEQRRAAEEAETTAAALRETAAAAERDGDAAARRANREVHRQLREQLDQARTACLDAMKSGNDPVGAWVTYRLAAARIEGTWAALKADYEQVTGTPQPPGPHAPPLTRRSDMATDPETFEQLLLRTMQQAEAAAREEAQTPRWPPKKPANRPPRTRRQSHPSRLPDPGTGTMAGTDER